LVIRELVARLGFSVDKSSLGQASSAINNTKSSMEKLGTTGIAAGSQASGGLNMLGSAANMAKGVMLGLGVAITAAFASAITGSTKASDEMQNLYGRLAVVTKSEQERLDVEQKLFDTSNRARQPLAETGDLFFKIAKASNELGTTQEQALQMTETVAKALTVGGAGVAQSQATILQLGQALGSGVLQGDELRSLNENATDLMQSIAQYFGTTVAGLRKMGKEGELTADKVAQAILWSQKTIDAQFEKMPLTVEQAMVMSGNAYKQGIFEFERQTGFFSAIAHAIVNATKGVGNNLTWLSNKVGGIKNLITILSVGFGILAASLVVANWGTFIGWISKATTALRGFAIANGAAMWEFVLIAAVIAIVVLAVQDLYTWINGGDSLLGRWLGSWEDFKAKSQTFFQPLIDAFAPLMTAMQNGWEQIKSSFSQLSPAFSAMGDAFSALWTVISPIISWICEGLTQIGVFLVSNVINYMLHLIEVSMQVGSYIVNAITAVITGMANSLRHIVEFVTAIMKGDFDGAINAIKDYFNDLGDTAMTILKNIGDAIGTFVMDKITSAKNAIADFLGWSTKTTAQAVNDSKTNYNQNIAINQNFNGGTAAENTGYMQDGAKSAFGDIGTNFQFGTP
jgi:tape measure domain-containing protein